MLLTDEATSKAKQSKARIAVYDSQEEYGWFLDVCLSEYVPSFTISYTLKRKQICFSVPLRLLCAGGGQRG